MGDGHGGIHKVASSWVEPSVDSRNCYPSWVDVSINVDTIAPPIGTTEKISASTLRFLPPNSSLYLHMEMFYIPLLYS